MERRPPRKPTYGGRGHETAKDTGADRVVGTSSGGGERAREYRPDDGRRKFHKRRGLGIAAQRDAELFKLKKLNADIKF